MVYLFFSLLFPVVKSIPHYFGQAHLVQCRVNHEPEAEKQTFLLKQSTLTQSLFCTPFPLTQNQLCSSRSISLLGRRAAKKDNHFLPHSYPATSAGWYPSLPFLSIKSNYTNSIRAQSVRGFCSLWRIHSLSANTFLPLVPIFSAEPSTADLNIKLSKRHPTYQRKCTIILRLPGNHQHQIKSPTLYGEKFAFYSVQRLRSIFYP